MRDTRIDAMRARAKARQLSFGLPAGQARPAWMGVRGKRGRWNDQTADGDAFVRWIIDEALPFDNLISAPVPLTALIARVREEETRQ
ncbi:MAG: hypothetical protein AAF761_07745 [Pseudomonadota bacterium]